jgi:hypothetical protein
MREVEKYIILGHIFCVILLVIFLFAQVQIYLFVLVNRAIWQAGADIVGFSRIAMI